MIKITDEALLKITLTFSFIGLIALFVISQTMKLSDTPLNGLDSIEKDSTIKVSGKVKEVSELEKVTFITVENTCETKLVLFKKIDEKNAIKINAGDKISAEGRLSEYEGKDEVLVEELIKN